MSADPVVDPLSVMLSPAPITGHAAPFSALAAELVARGHRVRVHTTTKHAPRFTAVGASVLPWSEPPDVDDADLPATFPSLTGLTGRARLGGELEQLFVGTASAQARDLQAAFAQEPWDVLVGDAASWGATLAAELLDAPWATVNILPFIGRSRHLPPPGLGLAPGRGPLGRARDGALRSVSGLTLRALQRRWDAERAAVGLTEGSSVVRSVVSPHLLISVGVPALELPRPDLPPQVHFIGRLAPAGPAVPRPAWWPQVVAAHAAGRPVVHVTQGTLHTDPSLLLRPSLEALGAGEALVVAITGRPGQSALPFEAPENVLVTDLLPYEDLLPLTSATVTNGGWGGVLGSLAHGVPLVVAGRDADKPEVGVRVATSGVGIDLRTDHPRPAQVARAVSSVLREPRYREAARTVAADLAAHDGPVEAATLLEALAATGEPQLRPGPAPW